MVKVKQSSVPKGNPKRLIGRCPATDWFKLECGFLIDKELTAGAGAGSMEHNFRDAGDLGRSKGTWKEAEGKKAAEESWKELEA
ncbi:Mpv17 transgene, kidney disease mutant-like (predicted), isoform CRA_a [Rattus norvegicus]|uniref:Mpv17 transgene, kidney disease mutant-like (Predicted), isoform CRA_a n=1 Tax=Rattus norvegicus TaxID=10116 RepID=A6K4F1_RAT|nr:Mpv17 transgene, kidney disease mutant-like (predicted), isoform CRA_a [Rattus norvegicus]